MFSTTSAIGTLTDPTMSVTMSVVECKKRDPREVRSAVKRTSTLAPSTCPIGDINIVAFVASLFHSDNQAGYHTDRNVGGDGKAGADRTSKLLTARSERLSGGAGAPEGIFLKVGGRIDAEFQVSVRSRSPWRET
jgi:hypothetical protein